MTTFREVMRSGSISKAAEAVGRTQPAVSIMISALEQELGFPLFLRENGKLSPTPEARYFLEETEAILARLDRTKETLGRIGSLEKGKLRIACFPAASGSFLPSVLTSFVKNRPEVELALIMRSSVVIEDLIASQQFDIGFSETPVPRASIRQTDFDLDCVCVMRADDPLADLPLITPADLHDKPMGILFDEHTTKVQLEAAFVAAGMRLNKRLELRTFFPGMHFVSEGFCYMVCDMITAYSHLRLGAGASDLVLRPFRPRVSSAISILTPAYVSQARFTREFASFLADSIRDMQAYVTAEWDI
ncbi:MAG: LysR substrate-binding domain-containing protein [Roseovarius sp.]